MNSATKMHAGRMSQSGDGVPFAQTRKARIAAAIAVSSRKFPMRRWRRSSCWPAARRLASRRPYSARGESSGNEKILHLLISLPSKRKKGTDDISTLRRQGHGGNGNIVCPLFRGEI